ncbi:MAG: hypothetical protein WKF37_11080 [Bryobacteraceae bacterium]
MISPLMLQPPGGMKLAMNGNLRGQDRREGGFQLTGDYPGSGSLQFAPISFATLQDLAAAAQGGERMPFDGSVEGKITFSGPAKKPELMRARLELPALQITPVQRTFTAKQVEELTIKSAEPIVLEYDGKTLQATGLHMIGRDGHSGYRRSERARFGLALRPQA